MFFEEGFEFVEVGDLYVIYFGVEPACSGISYLWELCYDRLLAKHDNVSASPGFEALGLWIK